MPISPFYTPLRYPGGKGKLAPFIKEVYRSNRLNDGTYVEPYAGGAAVALTLLLEGYARNIVINDIDKSIYSFWYTIINHTGEFIERIHDTEVTMSEWHKQKQVQSNIENFSILDIAFSTFFLNRTNRSGILQGGVIGGQNQNGPYKIDARYNKSNLIERIKLISQYKNRISVFNLDALDLITNLQSKLPQKSLIYFDPPYYNKGDLLYKNFYTHQDHVTVASVVKSLQQPWLVTYDSTEEIIDIYKNENAENFSICYSAHKTRNRGSEIMFYGNLQLPALPATGKHFHTSTN